jgi:hypothetical protein
MVIALGYFCKKDKSETNKALTKLGTLNQKPAKL